jgi:hypothetical protein
MRAVMMHAAADVCCQHAWVRCCMILVTVLKLSQQLLLHSSLGVLLVPEDERPSKPFAASVQPCLMFLQEPHTQPTAVGSA